MTKPTKPTKNDSTYQPTKAEMNEEFEVNASMEDVGKALMQTINPRWIDKPRKRRP